ncbi:hypothetical protein TGAM01_v211136 [Trichoderma gamsii]|uniref:Thiamine-triphosphatase n=1 Tax=Trichoderma gamsii TaxID=398673 RepID=A0A2P4Z6T6_9HYPO|nr:hypothetical protein TGAM01_v211136 [Trichoderma gamsii]PON19997.1 hypothetical protein TGAM01_v211136 [Trichoderma gamsii]
MAFRRLPTASCLLEVERKFRALKIRKLTQHGGIPHFRSLQKLSVEIIRDSYYDKSNMLSSAGAWVRKRNGEWQAKIKKGGNFTNSRFQELSHIDEIEAHVKRVVGIGGATSNFGLQPVATFSTTRESWIADGEFRIVLDTTDFDHQVGEVELQKVLVGNNGDDAPDELRQQREMQLMDEKIVTFMQTYAWAFSVGEPKGKLTAYFELLRTQDN